MVARPLLPEVAALASWVDRRGVVSVAFSLGVGKGTVSKWVNGVRTPNPTYREKIRGTLDRLADREARFPRKPDAGSGSDPKP